MKAQGYIGKIGRIDLSNRAVQEQELEEHTARTFIGGSGLGAKFLFDETDEHTEPFGEDNRIIFATGPLTGSVLFNSNRFEAVTKSPLTGVFAESSGGGLWGASLKRTGYDALIVRGKTDEPVYIVVQDGKITIKEAGELWGKDCFAATEMLKEREGKDAKVAVIGPAGEKLSRIACVITDGYHGRALGRCGIGSVMGSKHIKAVVVKGTRPVGVAERAILQNINKKMVPLIKENMKAVTEAGTASGLEFSEELGNLPIRNWYQGSWKEGAKKTTGMTLTKTRLTGNYHCGNCIISCGRVISAQGGPYDGIEMSGPEYETLGLFGANLLHDNLDAIIKANELCNRYGLDTISTGGVLGFAMEAYERGLIDEKDTGGIAVEWGSSESVIRLIESIGERKHIGWLLGEGVRRAAQEIGGIAAEFAAEIKGLELPAHDGRAKFTAAIGMATSNRGACHLSGFTHDFEEGAIIEDLGTPALTNRFTSAGKAENVVRMQNLMGMMDSLVVCKFALFGGLTVNPMIDALNAATGWDVDREEFFTTGERIFNLKRLYNTRLGISRKDDVLPPRMARHRRGGGTHELAPLFEMLYEYYQLRGWDEFGCPTKKTLVRLGLDDYYLGGHSPGLVEEVV
jgi:aldehyde:ferredoxin oxidoreductase